MRKIILGISPQTFRSVVPISLSWTFGDPTIGPPSFHISPPPSFLFVGVIILMHGMQDGLMLTWLWCGSKSILMNDQSMVYCMFLQVSTVITIITILMKITIIWIIQSFLPSWAADLVTHPPDRSHSHKTFVWSRHHPFILLFPFAPKWSRNHHDD